MDVTSGTYINLYDEERDIFIILNESNEEPTAKELEGIQEIVEKILKDPETKDCENRDLEWRLADAIENSGYNCAEFGGQVIIRQK